VPKAGIVV